MPQVNIIAVYEVVAQTEVTVKHSSFLLRSMWQIPATNYKQFQSLHPHTNIQNNLMASHN